MSSTPYTKEALTHFSPQHDFFVGIDSDGCVFDTMEIKQKECFHHLIAEMWGLLPIEPIVRETAEFVNLYSSSRGSNRFEALLRTLDLLRTRPEVSAAGITVPEMNSLRTWIANESKLGNPALEAHVAATHDAELTIALEWSHAVNRRIEEVVQKIPPFPKVRESLIKLGVHADIVVVSQTPTEALVREWDQNNIIDTVAFIAGQELGTKAEHIAMATTGRYAPDHILMIGDAPGDCRAAKANNALFFPINPAHEADAWQRFHDEAFDRFINGTFAGNYEATLIEQFHALLPDTPPW